MTWVSTPEAARVLGVSIRTLYRKIAAGEIPVRKEKERTLVGIAAETDNRATDTGNDSIPGTGTPHRRQRRMTPGKVGFDPVRHVREKIQAEEARLALRRIRQAHKALTEEEKEAKRMTKEEKKAEAEAKRQDEERRLQEERSRAEAQTRARLEAEDRRRKEEAERERQRKRREIVQDLKRKVIGGWWRSGYEIPSDVEAEATLAIDAKLSALAVEELPRSEVISIAEGIRDGIYRREMARQDEAKKQEKAAREEEEKAREAERRAKVAAVKRGLLYAEGKLGEIRDLDSLKKGFWLVDVRFGLDRTLAGTETPEAIQEAVDDILKPKIRELERQRRQAEEQEARREQEEADREREARKRQLIGHGVKYADGELEGEEELEPLERLALPGTVRRELEMELDGTESLSDVVALVDEILDRELR